jgi:hypothetical protein
VFVSVGARPIPFSRGDASRRMVHTEKRLSGLIFGGTPVHYLSGRPVRVWTYRGVMFPRTFLVYGGTMQRLASAFGLTCAFALTSFAMSCSSNSDNNAGASRRRCPGHSDWRRSRPTCSLSFPPPVRSSGPRAPAPSCIARRQPAPRSRSAPSGKRRPPRRQLEILFASNLNQIVKIPLPE